MKKSFKIPLIIAGCLLGLFLIVNLAFSLWLKYQLPDYLKSKTPYEITYQSLDVSVLTGGISANKIMVKTKQPDNPYILALDGTLQNLKISRLGIIQLLKNKQIDANTVLLDQPNLKIRLARSKNNKSEEDLMPFIIKNIGLKNGNIIIQKSDKSPLFSAKALNLDVKNLSLNQIPDELPFALDALVINAKDLYSRISPVYAVSMAEIKTDSEKLQMNDFELKSVPDFKTWESQFKNQKSLYNIKGKSLVLASLAIGKNKLALKGTQLISPEIIIRNRNQSVQKALKSKKTFELNLDHIALVNAAVSVLKSNGEKSLSVNELNANVKGFLMNSETANNKLPFSWEDYNITGKRFFYDAGKYYHLTMASFHTNPSEIDIEYFKMVPKVTRSEFVRMIPMENDLFNLSATRVHLSGLQWKFEKDQPDVLVNYAKFTQVDANIFRSKIPKDNPKEKPLYSKLLRSIKFPLLVKNLDLIQSKLVYEEDKPDTNGPGKVIFTQFNMNVKNINSNKRKGEKTEVPIAIHCQFMDASPMQVNWNFDTANRHDDFTIKGSIGKLPAADITPFIKPYMNITATGTISSLNFNFRGNNDRMTGTFRIKHKDLTVNLLDKDTKKKKNILSAVANLLVKKDSEKFPESVDIEVERNKQRSFFNFYWKGIEDGLKKTLLIIKVS
jgi:hypothetical protein